MAAVGAPANPGDVKRRRPLQRIFSSIGTHLCCAADGSFPPFMSNAVLVPGGLESEDGAGLPRDHDVNFPRSARTAWAPDQGTGRGLGHPN